MWGDHGFEVPGDGTLSFVCGVHFRSTSVCVFPFSFPVDEKTKSLVNQRPLKKTETKVADGVLQ